MVNVAEPLVLLSSCPCTTFHPCIPGQPESPWDQSAWYRTVPAGSEVGVGEERLTEGIVVCDGTAVEGVPVEQAPREKSRSPTRNTKGIEAGFKMGDSVRGSRERLSLLISKLESFLMSGKLFMLHNYRLAWYG
jgi:hypothetical protein